MALWEGTLYSELLQVPYGACRTLNSETRKPPENPQTPETLKPPNPPKKHPKTQENPTKTQSPKTPKATEISRL